MRNMIPMLPSEPVDLHPVTALVLVGLVLLGGVVVGSALFTGSPEPLAVVSITADPAGPDAQNLANESIVVENTGAEPIPLESLRVGNESGEWYSVAPAGHIAPGEQITIHTGTGTTAESTFYLNASHPLWDNDGGRIRITAGDQTLLDHTYET